MEVAARKPQRVYGRPFVDGSSGNPKGRAAVRERAAELFAKMAPDFGGELSATDTILLSQASLLLARAERVHCRQDIDTAIRMSSEARRLLLTLQRKRRKSDAAPPTLQKYLADRYGDSAPASDAQNTDQAGEFSDVPNCR